MQADIHPDRSVLRVSGPDRAEFLQGLVTNDIRKLDRGAVYAALLSPQGKYLADFLLVPDGDSILIDLAADQAAAVLQRLSMYKLRAAVTLQQTPLLVLRGTGPRPDGAVIDPRHPALGWRLYTETPPEQTEGTDWDALRVAHLIPEAGVELQPNDSYILEMGFERLNGVDFRKGCYVGQEVTARMHHKTELKKGLVQLTIDGSAGPGTEILCEGRPAGRLFTRSGDRALAHMRFDRLQAGLTAGEATLSPLPRA